MLPVSLSLNNKNVLIIGGGKVALRKAKLFLNQKANLTIMSSRVLDQFYDLDVKVISKDYCDDDLSSYFLVYAATDDKCINESVVDKCNHLSILCGSATYDEDASFFSMGYQENEKGIVALSMKQKLPYHKPILDDLMNVYSSYNDRLEILYRIRHYIINHVDDKKSYFHMLFQVPMDILEFLDRAIEAQKGFIFVYHHSDYSQDFHFTLQPACCVSLKEFEQYAYLFNALSFVKIVPMVLSEGKIYHRIKDAVPHLQCTLPLVTQQSDLDKILEIFECLENTILLIHAREKKYVKHLNLPSFVTVYELDDEFVFNKEKSYTVISFLMTHGMHYHQVTDKINKMIEQGFDIRYTGCLIDRSEIIEMLENKVKE